ncbi:MAG TPA: hypothetical protein VD866_19025 [Urbifossiella sp.]|nr:hypothetical protein [Urbifossiella sp.]
MTTKTLSPVPTLRFDERFLPPTFRTEPPPPKPLADLEKALVEHSALPRAKTVAALFEAYQESSRLLHDAYAAIDAYLHKAAAATVPAVPCQRCTSCKAVVRNAKFLDAKCQYCGHRPLFLAYWTDSHAPGKPERTFPLLPLPRPEPFGLTLARESPERVREEMSASLAARATWAANEVWRTLRDMVDEKHAGLITFAGVDPRQGFKDMCSYTSVRYFRVDAVTGRKTVMSSQRTPGGSVETETTTTEIETTVVMELLQEELIGVCGDPIGQFRGAVPRRIQPLFEKPPEPIDPLLRVYSGTQIREVRAEIEVRRVSRTEVTMVPRFVPEPVSVFRLDPAVVFADTYVLAAWLPGEE